MSNNEDSDIKEEVDLDSDVDPDYDEPPARSSSSSSNSRSPAGHVKFLAVSMFRLPEREFVIKKPACGGLWMNFTPELV